MKSAEADLDVLVSSLHAPAQGQPAGDAAPVRDPLQTLRDMTVNEFVPAFVELVEKYSKAGIAMQMDASSFLEGGREMKFEFCVADYRLVLHGTVTSEGIAFHETRYTPEFHGELTSGPMLRLRSLNAKTFREFICERLTALLRSAMRRKLT
jgi:hypothetical protein